MTRCIEQTQAAPFTGDYTSCTDEIYFIHKMGKQVGHRTFFSAGFLARTYGLYQVYTSLYEQSPTDPIFSDRSKIFYDSQHPLGRKMRRILFPSSQTGDADTLHSRGHKNISHSANLWVVGDICRLIADSYALINYFSQGQEVPTSEVIVIGTDAMAAITWIGTLIVFSQGGKVVGKANDSLSPSLESEFRRNAYHIYKTARVGIFMGDSFQLVTGATKVGIEMNHFIREPEKTELSALLDGAVDIGQGTSRMAYDIYLYRQATKIAKKVGGLKEATNVLSAGARSLPPSLLWTMRGFGIAGSVE